MAETELSVLATQCLDRRLPDKESLTREVPAWEKQRNAASGHAEKAMTQSISARNST